MEKHKSATRPAQASLAPFVTFCRVGSLTLKMESREGRELSVIVEGRGWRLDTSGMTEPVESEEVWPPGGKDYRDVGRLAGTREEVEVRPRLTMPVAGGLTLDDRGRCDDDTAGAREEVRPLLAVPVVGWLTHFPSFPGRQLEHRFPALVQAQYLQMPVLLHRQQDMRGQQDKILITFCGVCEIQYM